MGRNRFLGAISAGGKIEQSETELTKFTSVIKRFISSTLKYIYLSLHGKSAVSNESKVENLAEMGNVSSTATGESWPAAPLVLLHSMGKLIENKAKFLLENGVPQEDVENVVEQILKEKFYTAPIWSIQPTREVIAKSCTVKTKLLDFNLPCSDNLIQSEIICWWPEQDLDRKNNLNTFSTEQWVRQINPFTTRKFKTKSNGNKEIILAGRKIETKKNIRVMFHPNSTFDQDIVSFSNVTGGKTSGIMICEDSDETRREETSITDGKTRTWPVSCSFVSNDIIISRIDSTERSTQRSSRPLINGRIMATITSTLVIMVGIILGQIILNIIFLVGLLYKKHIKKNSLSIQITADLRPKKIIPRYINEADWLSRVENH